MFTADAATTNSSAKQTFFKYEINLLSFSGKPLKIPAKEFVFRVWPTVSNFVKKPNSVLFQGTISKIKKQNATYGKK